MYGNTLSENTFFSVKKEDIIILAVLTAFTLFFRIYLLQMINVGPDEIDYWYSAKQLVTGGPYPEIMHRTIRWAVILPVALFQRLFGLHPLVYYAAPVFYSLVQTVLLYLFGKNLFGRGTAFYAVLLFTAWPYMWRTGSQIRPAVFSLTYVIITLYALFLFLKTGRRRYFYVSAVFLFIAYESKITNLYFVPGILIILWLRRRRVIEPFKYGITLFVMYLAEHLSYWIFTGNRLGRLGIIAAYHMKGDFAEKLPHGFWGLFARYTEYMELPWKLLFILFIASTVYLLIKKTPWIPELTILHVSFFFFLTFMVKSLHPIEPVEPFLDRYYIVNLPTMCLVIVSAVRSLFPSGAADFIFRKSTLFAAAGLSAVMVVILTALPLPSSARRFVTPLAELSRHPIPRFFDFTEVTEEAVKDGIPFISIDTVKPLDTADRVFYDNPGKGREADDIGYLEAGGHTVYFLKKQRPLLDVSNPDQMVLLCSRFNFNMEIVSLGEIPSLSDFYSPEP